MKPAATAATPSASTSPLPPTSAMPTSVMSSTAKTSTTLPAKSRRKMPPRCNSLDGKHWLRSSISVWDDLRKSPEELRCHHPAQFPMALVGRLIDAFLPQGDHLILDPFCGSGSTLLAAQQRGKRSVGCELSAEFIALANQRLTLDDRTRLQHTSACEPGEWCTPQSVDLCITSPPYWNILNQKRTADGLEVRHYGNYDGDLGTVSSYEDYLAALQRVFTLVFQALKPGAHCCVVVMDLRKRDQFFPLHSDLATRLQSVGYRWDDLIIWNRQAEYNRLRPLGYPAVFRINKVHEFVLLMQKPGRLQHSSAASDGTASNNMDGESPILSSSTAAHGASSVGE
jgi:DNA modification methylase